MTEWRTDGRTLVVVDSLSRLQNKLKSWKVLNNTDYLRMQFCLSDCKVDCVNNFNLPSTILQTKISWLFISFFFLLSSLRFSFSSRFNLFRSFLASLSSLSDKKLPFLSGLTSFSSALESSLASFFLLRLSTIIMIHQN